MKDNSRTPVVAKITGLYANYFKVGYNAFEVVFDFGQWGSDTGEESIHTRIVTAPVYAKKFMETIEESITRFEKEFGIIRHDNEGV